MMWTVTFLCNFQDIFHLLVAVWLGLATLPSNHSFYLYNRSYVSNNIKSLPSSFTFMLANDKSSSGCIHSLSEQPNVTDAANTCRGNICFQLYNISFDEDGIYLTWERPDCQAPLRDYVVSLTNCRALSNPHVVPREFDSGKNNSIKIPSDVLSEDNLFSLKAFDVHGGCCATSSPTHLQTSAQPEGIYV